MITVVVIDESNEPVTELSTTIKDDSGRIYDIQSDPGIFPGVYTVMDDSYVMELTTEPKRFIFTGVKESLSTRGEFFVVTDECNCHVDKFAGPDTLVLR
jgi:hypothetical protein